MYFLRYRKAFAIYFLVFDTLFLNKPVLFINFFTFDYSNVQTADEKYRSKLNQKF